MAEVTKNSITRRHVLGDLVTRVFNVSGADGSTLTTGMVGIQFVDVQRSTSAGAASAVTDFTVSGGTITLGTAGGAMTSEVIMVVAKQG